MPGLGRLSSHPRTGIVRGPHCGLAGPLCEPATGAARPPGDGRAVRVLLRLVRPPAGPRARGALRPAGARRAAARLGAAHGPPPRWVDFAESKQLARPSGETIAPALLKRASRIAPPPPRPRPGTCFPGYYWPYAPPCKPCPVGQYLNVTTGVNNPQACKPCPNGERARAATKTRAGSRPAAGGPAGCGAAGRGRGARSAAMGSGRALGGQPWRMLGRRCTTAWRPHCCSRCMARSARPWLCRYQGARFALTVLTACFAHAGTTTNGEGASSCVPSGGSDATSGLPVVGEARMQQAGRPCARAVQLPSIKGALGARCNAE